MNTNEIIIEFNRINNKSEPATEEDAIFLNSEWTQDKRKKVTKEEIKEFVTGHYYCDEEEDGTRELWQPFENEEESVINNYIRNDVLSLTRFLKEHNIEVEE